ncbi:hypothetical protein B0H13DRAFT_2291088 [Mycena leptocephala]|nr:hypothetical protein B0H13DRAFT_2291088 [Mycena leptocephala]
MSATPPATTPATACTRPDVDVSGDSDGDLEGGGVRVAHGDLDGDGDEDRAGDGAGAGEGARDGADAGFGGVVDGYAPVSVALRARLPSMRILRQKVGVRACAKTSSLPTSLRPPSPSVSPSSTVADPLIERGRRWLRAAAARERGAERTRALCAFGCLGDPAYTVGSARSECGGDESRVPPACTPAYGRIRHTALDVDPHSRALLEAKVEVENARWGTRMRLTPRMWGQ